MPVVAVSCCVLIGHRAADETRHCWPNRLHLSTVMAGAAVQLWPSAGRPSTADWSRRDRPSDRLGLIEVGQESVRGLSGNCQRSARSLSEACQESLRGLSEICQRSVRSAKGLSEVCQVCQRSVRGLSEVCQRSVRGL